MEKAIDKEEKVKFVKVEPKSLLFEVGDFEVGVNLNFKKEKNKLFFTATYKICRNGQKCAGDSVCVWEARHELGELSDAFDELEEFLRGVFERDFCFVEWDLIELQNLVAKCREITPSNLEGAMRRFCEGLEGKVGDLQEDVDGRLEVAQNSTAGRVYNFAEIFLRGKTVSVEVEQTYCTEKRAWEAEIVVGVDGMREFELRFWLDEPVRASLQEHPFVSEDDLDEVRDLSAPEIAKHFARYILSKISDIL